MLISLEVEVVVVKTGLVSGKFAITSVNCFLIHHSSPLV